MTKVSVITPCYNSVLFIDRTIKSVRDQKLSDWEYIVVDDGSTDESASVIKRNASTCPRVHFISQLNAGVCNARNKGFMASERGSQYILFLDADDFIEPEMLSTLTDYMDLHPEAGLAYCDFTYVDTDDKPIANQAPERHVASLLGTAVLSQNDTVTPFESVFCGAAIWPSFTLLRRSVYERTMGWDEQLGQHHEDLDLFLRMALLAQVHFVPQRLCRYRRYAGQSSSLPERHTAQSNKFDDKWKGLPNLTTAESLLVKRAFQLRNRRLAPKQRLSASAEALREGNFPQAIRHSLWALLRYSGLIT